MKRISTPWLVGGVAAVALLALLAWALAPRPLAVEAATAAKGRFETAIEEDAKTRLRDRFVVAAPLAGRLSRITLREGDVVAAGAVVASLAPSLPPLHDERTLRELRARVATARAQVDQAAAQRGAAQAALDHAQLDMRRSEELARGGFVSPTKLDADRLALQTAQKGLEAAREAQRAAGLEVEQALAALSAVQQGGASTVFALRAPVAGRVLRLAQTSETTVAAGTPLVEIGDTQQLEVVAELLTTDALQARPGSVVRIERWGGPGSLNGRVRSVEPGGFTKVSALGVEEQRVRVLVDITSPYEQWRALGDGFRVGVRILTRSVDDALIVPVSAVFPLPGSAPEAKVDTKAETKADAKAAAQPEAESRMAVFVLKDERARLQAVQLGGRNASQAWVLKGLSAGDRVIVYPSAAVQDGVRVSAGSPRG